MGEDEIPSQAVDQSHFLFKSIIIVRVGPQGMRFDLHKEYICGKSDFFKAACSGNFKEAHGVIKLPEQDPEIFKHFVHWLYTGRLCGFVYMEPSMKSLEAAVRLDLKRNGKSPFLSKRYQMSINCTSNLALDCGYFQDAPLAGLVSLYILADQLQVRGLKDTIINAIIEVYSDSLNGYLFWGHQEDHDRSRWLLGPAAGIKLAWEHLPDPSPLRSLILKLFCDNACHTDDFRGLYISDFMAEAFAVMVARAEDQVVRSGFEDKSEICKHHVHDVDCSFADPG